MGILFRVFFLCLNNHFLLFRQATGEGFTEDAGHIHLHSVADVFLLLGLGADEDVGIGKAHDAFEL